MLRYIGDFNPRSPRGGATQGRQARRELKIIFQSTLPTRGSDNQSRWFGERFEYFNPRSPRGGATGLCTKDRGQQRDFNPRSPRGGATCTEQILREREGFQSTLPTRGSDSGRAPLSIAAHFNPRSPRGGATATFSAAAFSDKNFNPRSPRGGATLRPSMRIAASTYFNPRSPRGGATVAAWNCNRGDTAFQSTLPTRGSDFVLPCICCICWISIHAPHEGERQCRATSQRSRSLFQSTLPTRGSDTSQDRTAPTPAYFNPRSPRGGATRFSCCPSFRQNLFQSTLPTRGSDTVRPPQGSGRRYFNPRSPRGGATIPELDALAADNISIHAPHEGERRGRRITTFAATGFQSTLPTRGSDMLDPDWPGWDNVFQSTLPTRGSDEAKILMAKRRIQISIHAPHEGERLGEAVGWI